MWDLGSWIFLALGVLALVAALASLREGVQFSRYVRRSGREGASDLPPVAILAPVRAEEEALAANLEGLLDQDYPRYRVVFAVDGEDDPAVAVIERAIARHRIPAKIVLSPGPHGGSGKAAALARAAEELAPGDRVVVTWDADARPHRHWLASLVSGLGEGVGAATGYRWYSPAGGFWTAVRSAWNATGYSVLFRDRHNFAWGGSTAIPREVFESAGIRARWPSWLSDDLAVTVAVKERGLRVRFVPRAVCVTEDPCDRRACVDWTTQQSAFVYAYYPRLTKYAALAYAMFDGIVVLGIVGLLLAVFVAPEYAVGAALLLADIPLTAVKAEQRRAALAGVLPEWRETFTADRAAFLLASLVVPWLMLLNLWRVRRLTAIAWRGRTYPMPRPIEKRY